MQNSVPIQTPIQMSLEQRRRAWFVQLLAEHDKTVLLLPKIEGMTVEIKTPEWYDRTKWEYIKALCPIGNVTFKPGMTPRRLGLLSGRSCMHAVWLFEFLADQKKRGCVGTSVEGQSAPNQKNEQMFTWNANAWFLSMQKFAMIALCSSINQTYEDMSDFLLGFSHGFSKKAKALGLDALGNTNSDIYRTMLMHWRTVDQFKSVSELHKFLIQELGERRVRGLKRIEKICQRIGLRFRKSGRPKKIIQTLA